MAKAVALVAVHGMGDTERRFDEKLKSRLRKRLGEAQWSRVSWNKVYYQPVLQKNQKRVMDATLRMADVDWIKLRRFVLYGFSDAAGMESRPYARNSVYQKIQEIVLKTLDRACAALEDPRCPVVIIAHSLGCQVISNYVWDAQRVSCGAGVFRDNIRNPIGKSSPIDRFRRLKTLRFLFTSGCNIPIFIAGRPESKIKPVTVNARGWNFRWQNYYDPDDVLGWPLHPVNAAYRAAVAVDQPISAGGPLNSWTPMSHSAYWTDGDFLDPVEQGIRTLL